MFNKNKNLRFVKLLNRSKTPFEKDWQNKPYTFDEIKTHISQNINYGVLGGYGGLIIIDADKVTSAKDKNLRFEDADNILVNHIDRNLPETLKIQTGSGAYHYYFYCEEQKNKILLKSNYNDTPVHWGEVISYGSQVVGPNSIHPNGKKYKVVNKSEIATISKEQLNLVLANFLPSVQRSQDKNKHENKEGIDQLNVEDIWGISGLKRQDNEYVGPHPMHGSSTGVNFWINPNKNTWHCFRDDSGGGPASAIAVKHGIIDCHDAKAGVLRGEQMLEVLKIARKEYGLKKNNIESFETIKIKEEEKLNLWTFDDFENLEIDETYLVDKCIYPGTTTMLYSPPGEFKSLVSVDMALSIAQGREWMGYETQQNAVLYCDKENNDRIIKERLMALYKGKKYTTKEMPLYFLRREGDLLNGKFLKKLFTAVEEYNIKAVFFDTLHRFADYDENNSDDINRIYTRVFQPLMEKYGCSIIFLHHTNKDGNYRGSGDFLGMVDTAYKVRRFKKKDTKSNTFEIINEKNRSGEVEKLMGDIEFTMDENDKLDIITIEGRDIEQAEKEDNKKFNIAVNFIKDSIEYGELKTRKDFVAILTNKQFDGSESTIKDALKWMVKNDMLIRDSRNRYKLPMNETLDKDSLTQDMEDNLF